MALSCLDRALSITYLLTYFLPSLLTYLGTSTNGMGGTDCCASMDWGEPQTCSSGYHSKGVSGMYCVYVCCPGTSAGATIGIAVGAAVGGVLLLIVIASLVICQRKQASRHGQGAASRAAQTVVMASSTSTGIAMARSMAIAMPMTGGEAIPMATAMPMATAVAMPTVPSYSAATTTTTEAVPMTHCMSCGSPLVPGGKFCGSCGTAVKETSMA